MARGNISQRSPGTWSIRVEIPTDPVTGKRRQRRETFRGTKREAETKLTALLKEVDTGGFVNPSKANLGKYLNQWIEDYARPNLAPKTTQNYEHMINKHLAPKLGILTLGRIRPDHIQTYISDKLTSGLSAKTVKHHYVTLHTALAHALKQGLISRNPCDSVTAPKPQQQEMNVLDEDGVQRVLEAAKSTEYYYLFYFLLFTGCRRSEALALRWLDLDLTLAQASITRSMHHLRDGRIVFRQPKTIRSRRSISLPPSLAISLRQHRTGQASLKATLGLGFSDEDLVFCHSDGSPYLPDTITHYWTKLTRRLGFQGIRLHDARHTHATMLMKDNVDPLTVQRRLGHASITTTFDIYGHLIPEHERQAAAKFDERMAIKPWFEPEMEAVRISP
ncbi:MAG TPA: site-specific integrase [Dehalococcoidia bacterium]|nr:site-specific integrase [Dehalococcoidia bacterium]